MRKISFYLFILVKQLIFGCSVHGQHQNLDKAVEMFNMARNMGVPLDEKAYSNLISCYEKAGNDLFLP